MYRFMLLAALAATAFAAPPRELARQWIAAKFLGRAEAVAAEPHMLLGGEDPDPIDRHRIRDRAFLIKDRKFEDGIRMPSPAELQVKLTAPASTFECMIGVDSNDLGYYANAGRGSVVATVEAGGRELFRSPVLREGLDALPVRVELNGAREFTLKLAAVGKHSFTWQKEWDQLDWADARVTLVDGKVLRLSDLPQGPLPAAFDTAPPFSFHYDGRLSSELVKNWKRELKGDGRTHFELTYTDPATGLVVRVDGKAYEDFPIVEWTVYLKNGGSAPTPIIDNLQPIDARFERAETSEFLLRHWRGTPNSPADYEPLQTPLGPEASKRITTRGGRATDTDMCYFNVDTGANGLILALGWPGQWAATFERDKGRGLRIRGGQELTHFRLLPGEEVRTPLVALQFWEGDWIVGQNVWRRWMIAHNVPRVDGQLPPPQLAGGSNRQTIEMQDANEANQLAYLKRDLDAGFPLDYWWMDAGWYPFVEGWWATGNWETDPKRFPNGFAPISKYAHERGVKIIVWFEPERVFKGTWLDKTHPEWLLRPKEGTSSLLYLGNQDAWNWLVERVSGIIRRDSIDFYRQDFNFEPLELWRANDAPDRQGITEIRHVTGYLAYWDELLRRFPKLRIDSCASGGRRNDLETLRRAVPLWRSDFPFQPASMQSQTYGMAFWMPYFGTGINSLDPYIFRSQMTPATGIGIEPARHERGYERLKRLVAQWRSVAGFYYGDFYPMTKWSLDDTTWMGWQFDRPEQGDGIVQAFRRPQSAFASALFRLRGLDPAARYQVVDIDSSEAREFSGRELLDQGLPVTIKDRPGAAILQYRRLK